MSTQKQGALGLDLEAQQAAVNASVTDPAQLLSAFVEVESGKKNHWPHLQARRLTLKHTNLVAQPRSGSKYTAYLPNAAFVPVSQLNGAEAN